MEETIIVGIDEAGLGPIAGPFCMSAVALSVDTDFESRVRDSKKMSAASREAAIDEIHDLSIFCATIIVEPYDIDRRGVGRVWDESTAALLSTIVDEPWFRYSKVIIDGNRTISGRLGRYLCPIPKADDKYPAVSAASVLAKYAQTCAMEDADRKYPGYGFAQHHGYGTKQHMEALGRLGACPIHRKSYDPIKKVVSLFAGSSRG